MLLWHLIAIPPALIRGVRVAIVVDVPTYRPSTKSTGLSKAHGWRHTNHPCLRLLMYFDFSPDVGKHKEYQLIHRISLTYMWQWSNPLIRFNVQLGRFAKLKRKSGQALVSHFGDGEDLSGNLGNAWNNMTVLAGSNICTFNVKTTLLVDDCRCCVHTIACPFDNKHVCFIRQFGKTDPSDLMSKYKASQGIPIREEIHLGVVEVASFEIATAKNAGPLKDDANSNGSFKVVLEGTYLVMYITSPEMFTNQSSVIKSCFWKKSWRFSQSISEISEVSCPFMWNFLTTWESIDVFRVGIQTSGVSLFHGLAVPSPTFPSACSVLWLGCSDEARRVGEIHGEW